MKGFCPLASGSKGNSIYFGSEQTKILIDAGISSKAIVQRLETIGVGIADIQAILITHDHVDHIQGLRVLAFKYGIPVFANCETAKGITNFFHDCPKFKIFSTGESFRFGDLDIHPFSISHDTMDPVGFTITTGDFKVGFCADLGIVTPPVRHSLADCHWLYLEANHDPDMVWACSRPMIYKQRVLSRYGHLSNDACAELVLQLWHPKLQHVHLAHLSSECNSPEKALTVVTQALYSRGYNNVAVSVAPQDRVAAAIHFYPREALQSAISTEEEAVLLPAVG